MLSGTVSAAPSFTHDVPKNDIQAAEDTVPPDFQDDFSKNSGAWELGDCFKIKDGALVAPIDSYSYMSTVNDKWENFTLTYDFVIKEMTTFENKGFWFGPIIRGTTYMFQRNTIQYNSTETGVQNGLSIPSTLEDNVTYSVKIEAQEKKSTVYIKKEGEKSYTKLGVMPISQKVGTIGFSSYPASIAYDNVKVWDTTERPFKFKSPSVRLDVNTKESIAVVNTSGEDITYTSADEKIAAVDSEGNVTAVSEGKTEIIAEGATGYKMSCSVIVVLPVTAITLCTYERTLYKDDSINFQATVAPENATNKELVWKSSNENVISLMGEASNQKGIKAENVGTATLTVSTPDGKISAECEFNIVERPAPETGEAVFAMKGTSHLIPETTFGVCGSPVGQCVEFGGLGRDVAQKNTDLLKKLVDDIGFNHVKIFMANYDPVSGLSTNPILSQEKNPERYYVEDYVNSINEVNTLGLWDASSTQFDKSKEEKGPDIDLMFDIIKRTKALTPDRPLYITCNTEAYAMGYEYVLPTVKDYIELFRELSKRVKSEVDPNAKFGITLCGPALYRGVLADPNNWGRWEGDMEYTQGSRIAEWHTELAKDQSWFDAVDMHMYQSAYTNVNVTPDEFLHSLDKRANYEARNGLYEITRLFPDKEIWCTEWNDFEWQFSYGDISERTRAQTQKNVGSCVTVMQELCEHMTNERMTISSFFHCNDANGFGIVQGDTENPTYLPYYYMLKEGGRLFGKNSKNKYAYPLGLAAGKVVEDVMPMNSDSEELNLQEAYAYGFGDEDNIRDVIFTNPTYKKMRVKLADAELSKTWCYKPAKEYEPYPKFYLMDGGMQDYDASLVPMPETYEDGEYEEYIELPPYSITTASVKSSAEKIPQTLKEKLGGSLVLKEGSGKVILPDGFIKNIDVLNSSVKPEIINGRTMIPARVAAEALDAWVLWNSENETIGIEALNNRINMKVGSDEMVLDYELFRDGDERTIMLDTAPQVINDRTMIPLRALGEAMNKTVTWDESNGIITVGTGENTLSAEDLAEITEILK